MKQKILETHINLNKEEAYNLLEKGYKIRHEYYDKKEFIYMKNDDIYDEKGYALGYSDDEMIMNQENGWSIYFD